MNKIISEHLSQNDLNWLVDDGVLIDMHKTKLGEDKDYIVLSIAVTSKTPANDLATFIENSVYKFKDVEVSPATDTKGRYLIYVELERNSEAFEVIDGILKDCSRLSGIEIWKFKTLNLEDYILFDRESFDQYVVTDPVVYDQQHPKEETSTEDEALPKQESVAESIKDRLKFLLNY